MSLLGIAGYGKTIKHSSSELQSLCGFGTVTETLLAVMESEEHVKHENCISPKEEANSLEVKQYREGNSLIYQQETTIELLKDCIKKNDLLKGTRIHTEALNHGLLKTNVKIGTTVVSMYAKFGAFQKAHETFNKLPVKDLVTWNALIAGYSQHNHNKETLKCFERMQIEGLSPNAITFVCVLKACGSASMHSKGQQLHAIVAIEETFAQNAVVGNGLVDMYAKVGAIATAQELFNGLVNQDIISWNTLITGYCQHGYGERALECFETMKLKGFIANAITIVCILKTCAYTRSINKGQQIHAVILGQEILRNNNIVWNALLCMYTKCGAMSKAENVFSKLSPRNLFSWTALIAGYAEYGHADEAVKCFEQMQYEGFSPDAATFVCILKACGSRRVSGKGEEFHAEIVRQGFLTDNIVVGNALLDMYVKLDDMAKAQEVFNDLLYPDIVSWTTLLTAYAEHGHGDDALTLFDMMESHGVTANAITFISALKASGKMGAVVKGQELHDNIILKGLTEESDVENVLIDMYAKCGVMSKAQEVFNKLKVRDVVSWNSLIAGYAQLGKDKNVLLLLNQMVKEGKTPNLLTFTSLFNACAHAGLTNQGFIYFGFMSKYFEIIPTLEHYTCMVDFFGRAGQLEKAFTIITEMPFHTDHKAWLTFLGACRICGNIDLGKFVFNHAVEISEQDPAAYVCMRNIFAAAGLIESD